MEDERIVELYWQRDEEALRRTDEKYGPALLNTGRGWLGSTPDAQECVNDTYHRAWTSIPPQRPRALFAYLARILRNLCLDRYRAAHAQKRCAALVELSEELQACLPALDRAEDGLEEKELVRVLNGFVAALEPLQRRIFLRRYWYGDSVARVAELCGVSQAKVKTDLYRLRSRLKEALEKEGIAV